MDQLAPLVHFDHASDFALHNAGVAVRQSSKGMHVHPLALIAVAVGTVVFPHHLLVQGNLLERRPGIVKKDVSVGKQVHVMMARVTALRSTCFVRPKHFAGGVGDRQYVFPIRC